VRVGAPCVSSLCAVLILWSGGLVELGVLVLGCGVYWLVCRRVGLRRFLSVCLCWPISGEGGHQVSVVQSVWGGVCGWGLSG